MHSRYNLEFSGAISGGYALGNPIVRGGVHEFTFTLDVAQTRLFSACHWAKRRASQRLPQHTAVAVLPLPRHR